MTGPFVKPDVQAFLDQMAATPRPPFTAEFIAMIRKMPPDMMAGLDEPVGDLAVIRDLAAPGPAGDIAVRLYDPRDRRQPGPVVVFFHGGGFVVGGIDTHAGLAAALARKLDLPVLSVDYRLSPEHPWPAAPDDAEAVARWVAGNPPALGLAATGLILCGDSAGGNLTIVTVLALRDRPAALPVILQAPIYPATDHGGDWESRRLFADGYGLNGSDMVLYDQHYAADHAHWRSSPLTVDQAGMPPTFLVTAGLDPLRDEGRAYAAKAIAAGVPTTFREVAGTIHGFATYRRAIPSARADTDAILTELAAMIGALPAPA